MGDGRRAGTGLTGRRGGESGRSRFAVVGDGQAHASGRFDRRVECRPGMDEASPAQGVAAPAIRAAMPWDACSEVPQPVTVTGCAEASAEAISSAITAAAGDGR